MERILFEPPAATERASDEITGVIVDDERHDAAVVIVAGGAWSPALASPLGLRVPVEPQRGQIAHLVLQGADSGPWPMVSGFRDHYLVAWPGGRVAAGATRETGSGFDPRSTAAGVREVLAEALRLAPGLAAATLLEVRVGLRPLAADGLPILGPVPGCAGLWLATGHGPSGLTLGPLSGKLVAEAALGGEWAAWLEAFSVTRSIDRVVGRGQARALTLPRAPRLLPHFADSRDRDHVTARAEVEDALRDRGRRHVNLAELVARQLLVLGARPHHHHVALLAGEVDLAVGRHR